MRFPAASFVSLGLVLINVLGGGNSQATAAKKPDTSGESVAFEIRAPMVESTEPPAPKPLYERVNDVFAGAVSLMKTVFFYRVMSEPESYLQTNHREFYTRPAGGSGPFVRLGQPPSGDQDSATAGQHGDPTNLSAEISLEQAQALWARGKLIGGTLERPYREGKIERPPEPPESSGGTPSGLSRKVEYLTLEIDVASQYDRVETSGGQIVFRKRLPFRNLVSDDPGDEISLAQARAMAENGWLKLDAEKLQAGDPQPYLLDVAPTDRVSGAPLVVIWLAAGSVFFTFYMGWFNIWGFRHAVDIVRGKFDNPSEPGEVSHFQALASALSATVGLGNIAGVTIAITLGGPGAFFWMMACGVFGMCSKFVECTLGQTYRRVKEDGTVLGGPMQYLYEGLRERGVGPLGLVLAIAFSVMCVMASFGAGNMLQANQSGAIAVTLLQRGDVARLAEVNANIEQAAANQDFAAIAEYQKKRSTIVADMKRTNRYFSVAYGVLLATMVAVVIIGGIKRIGAAAEKVVPSMCILYLSACAYIVLSHLPQVPSLVALIFQEAFTGRAYAGGALGVLVVGVQRAAFSNEAGVGSAAIAHSAARTKEPVREGAVALLGPFIDTVVVCSMTALVILITGAWDNQAWIVEQGLEGAQLTLMAFEQEISWFPFILVVAVILFAYSTIISWSYYGERCWERLFGPRSIFFYRVLYVGCVLLGAVVHLGAVLDFADMMLLSMAFPNILGAVILAPRVRRELRDYWRRLKAGEFDQDTTPQPTEQHNDH